MNILHIGEKKKEKGLQVRAVLAVIDKNNSA